MKLYSILETILKSDSTNLTLIDNQGDLMGNKIHDLVDKTDENLIGLLLENQELREKFFSPLSPKGGNIVYVFKTSDFKFFLDENKIDNSYTQYENRIGLTANGKFLKDSSDVVLDFPYKDCILEGGQSTEEGTDTYFEYDTNDNHYQEKQAKRKEIFFNTILAKDEIDRLLEPKAFTNFKHYASSTDKSRLVPTFERDENGTIKDNLIIKGNNLLALHSLKSEFAGKVKLIYIDPPYNTGNDSFAYNDNFNHSTWLTFMRNRLLIAKELLREDGTIVISIDHNEVAYNLILLDEIFGRTNRKNIVTVKRSSVSGAKVINPGVVNVAEALLIYSNNSNSWKPNKVFKEKVRDERYNNFITNIDDNPEYWKYSSVLDAFSIDKQIEKSKLKKVLGTNYEIELEHFFYENKDKIIRFAGLDDKSISAGIRSLKLISKNDNSKTYVFERENLNTYYLFNGNAILFFKDRLIKIDEEWKFGEMISDIWDDVLPNDIHNEGGVTLRKGKKPEKLLNRILDLTTKENDIILDYHLGSGTTAAVAHKMNRQYIGIEQLDYGNNDSVIRLENVLNGEVSGISKLVNWQGGGSFIYLELAKNNQNAIEYIQTCESYEALIAFFDEMCNTYFLHYNVKVNEFREVICKEDNFKKLTLEQQKIMFAKMLDLNQLYVNVSDMKDSRFGLSENDIAITKDFYQL